MILRNSPMLSDLRKRLDPAALSKLYHSAQTTGTAHC